jgi:hypothetical protein
MAGFFKFFMEFSEIDLNVVVLFFSFKNLQREKNKSPFFSLRKSSKTTFNILNPKTSEQSHKM